MHALMTSTYSGWRPAFIRAPRSGCTNERASSGSRRSAIIEATPSASATRSGSTEVFAIASRSSTSGEISTTNRPIALIEPWPQNTRQGGASMYRSIARTSLALMALALSVVPGSAQQPVPTTAPGPPGQPVGVIRQAECQKLICEINTAQNVRFDPAAANARQVAANAARLQADGRYAECWAAAQPTRDLLAMTAVSAVAPDVKDWRLWAHPDEDSAWVRRPQRP